MDSGPAIDGPVVDAFPPGEVRPVAAGNESAWWGRPTRICAVILLCVVSYTAVEQRLAHYWKNAVAHAVDVRKKIFGDDFSAT